MHTGYQWYCGFTTASEVPDHSTISRLKNEHWAQLGASLWAETLNKVADRCIEVGLVSGKHLATDGTSVRADASITSYERLTPGRTVEEFGYFPYRAENAKVVETRLWCRPCTHNGRKRCPLGHFKCMREVGVEGVE